LLGLLANWRLILAGSLIAAALAGWAYVSHLRHALALEKTQAQSATRQASTDRATAGAADRYAGKLPQFHERANRDVANVQSAPSASAPLDPDFRSRLCDSGLCDPSGKPDHHSSISVPGSLPGTDQ